MDFLISGRLWRPLPLRVAALLAVALSLVLPLGGCMAPTAPAQTPEEVEDVRQTLQSNEQTVDRYLKNTQAGQNVSEFSLGWTAYSILVTLASQDPELNRHFSEGGGDVQTYMKTRFRKDPAGEVKALDAMAQEGHPAYRRTARYALESLRHIPNGSEPAEAQARDRADLVQALTALKTNLHQAAQAVTAGE